MLLMGGEDLLEVQNPSRRAAQTYGIKTWDCFAFHDYLDAVRHGWSRTMSVGSNICQMPKVL